MTDEDLEQIRAVVGGTIGPLVGKLDQIHVQLDRIHVQLDRLIHHTNNIRTEVIGLRMDLGLRQEIDNLRERVHKLEERTPP